MEIVNTYQRSRKVLIRTKWQIFEIPTISEDESEWLAQKLSLCLNVPIYRKCGQKNR